MEMKQNIEIHIEELVLHGFEHTDRFRIGTAVAGELTRLLTERGIPPSLSHNRELPRLDGGTFNLAPNTKPELFGTQVAQGIYGGLEK